MFCGLVKGNQIVSAIPEEYRTTRRQLTVGLKIG
jgi:hypothetical protein